MDIEANLRKGEVLFMDGLIDEAETEFQEVLRHKPEHYEALNNLGVIRHSKGFIKQAEQLFLKALIANGEYPDAFSNLADIYHDTNQTAKEADCLEKLLAFQGDDHILLNRLAFLFIEMNKIGRANDLIELSLNICPGQEDLKRHLESLKPKVPITTRILTSGKENTASVSIGLPVYNGGKYLEEALQSLLSQDFEDFELIISDNCSTDNTKDISCDYRDRDRRIRYYRFNENLGAIMNFRNVLGHSSAPYFMWASHDDLHEASFIRKCLSKLQGDPSIVLVYPQTKLLQSDSTFLGLANDLVKADQEDAVERFRHLIWELGLCNMFYGLFRSDAIKKAKSWEKTLFTDNLLLAEIALAGKIIQVPEALFIRRFTRNYNYTLPDDRNAQLIGDCDPNLFNEGLCLPHCRLAFAHLDLLNNTALENSSRDVLTREVITCFRGRFGIPMKYEIDRAVHYLSQGIFYWNWRNDPSEAGRFGSEKELNKTDHYRITVLLKNLQEALFLFPERDDLIKCYERCLTYLISAGTKSGFFMD